MRQDGIGGPDLVPVPARLERLAGTFILDAATRIAADGPALAVALLVRELLGMGTGLALEIVPVAVRRSGDIVLRLADGPPPEGYILRIDEETVDVRAAGPAGLAWGVQTLRQLLPPDTLRHAAIAPPPYPLPCLRVEDAPRFSWRGLMLDVARHFMPKDFVLRLIDLAAQHKLNVVQLHLTDDQGWRLEMPGWPRLTDTGAWRPNTAFGGTYDAPVGWDDSPHGGYYSLSDLREMAAFAARRHVTLVPEVGFPGHTQAAIASYPELGMTPDPGVRTRWGHSPHVLTPSPRALNFIRDVIGVVTQTFPSPWVHIGGDECPRDAWRGSAYARSRAAELRLDSVDALQSWFLRYGIALLDAAGRRAVGWDQVLEDGGVPSSTIVMAWRDFDHDTALDALTAGHDVVQCPTATTYLDHGQSDDPTEPPSLYGICTFEQCAAYDPQPPGTYQGQGRVLGTQGHAWTENMRTPREVEYMVFPRLAAIAEAAWSGPEQRFAVRLGDRLTGYLSRLAAQGVNYRPLGGTHPWQRYR
jgi:hexosaminidase